MNTYNLHMIKTHFDFYHFLVVFVVTTLALGLRPKQGLTKVRAKIEAQESHFILPGV
jgi:hypothetical protein